MFSGYRAWKGWGLSYSTYRANSATSDVLGAGIALHNRKAIVVIFHTENAGLAIKVGDHKLEVSSGT